MLTLQSLVTTYLKQKMTPNYLLSKTKPIPYLYYKIADAIRNSIGSCFGSIPQEKYYRKTDYLHAMKMTGNNLRGVTGQYFDWYSFVDSFLLTVMHSYL